MYSYSYYSSAGVLHPTWIYNMTLVWGRMIAEADLL